ncbi:hypothetical protein Ddye_017077 [Dipteronia dyeriana]|uniref:Transposase n=1 Tax=Dipteronia dyeriana TaxID=168575 RepID=A0AAD9U8K3_9ROSI|nr:hypothetical protein Ddye_017077 [Dipteronia dyeriana]
MTYQELVSIAPRDNTQQFRSSGGSNHLFTESRENLCGVPPKVTDDGELVSGQFDDVFGCQIEINYGQFNHHYNDFYNDINNEQNSEPNVGPTQQMDDEENLHPVDNVDNNEEEDLKRLVGHFAMRQKFEWKVKRSNKITLRLVCLINNCTWKLRAGRRDEETYFQVRSFVSEHTCPLEEIHRRHRQASAVIIGEVVAHRLQQQDGRLMRPKDIIADMETMYDIQILYSKAHHVLQYVLSQTYGTHEETFKLLSSFGYVLEQQNPGTITDLQCDEDGRFLYFFMSLGASLIEFRRCIRPVIVVDNTHLKGRFGGIMFVATAQDGNEQHASVEAGISKVFPDATHTICCWHFSENVKKRFHKKDVASIMDKAVRSYTELKYNCHMEELRNLHENAFNYVIEAGPHKWSPVHCPERMYRVMTTNAAECINSCLKFALQLPMLTLAEFIRNMLQRGFYDRHRTAQSMGHQLTNATHLVLLKRVEKCAYMTVNPVG